MIVGKLGRGLFWLVLFWVESKQSRVHLIDNPTTGVGFYQLELTMTTEYSAHSSLTTMAAVLEPISDDH